MHEGIFSFDNRKMKKGIKPVKNICSHRFSGEQAKEGTRGLINKTS